MTYMIVETMFPGAYVKKTELGDDEGYARRRYAQSVESSLMSRLSEVLGVDAMSRRKMFSKSKTTKKSFPDGLLKEHRLVYEQTTLRSKHLDLGKSIELVWDLRVA